MPRSGQLVATHFVARSQQAVLWTDRVIER
jgi:hypothetical protein